MRYLLIALILLACNKKDAVTDPCSGFNYDIEFDLEPAIGSQNNGSIIITYPIGDTVSYSLNNGSFQTSRYFTSLAPGNYTVTAKNNKGCSDNIQVTIPQYGPKYALVKQLITGYCGPCHLNGGMEGGKNFDTDNSIVNSWDRIKARAVDGNPSYMPQGGQLTTVDKNKIIDWINAGHRITD
jgi:hypothetical protein